MESANPMRSTRAGWVLFTVAAGIIFLATAAGFLIPFTASPSPSTIVTGGVVVGVPLAAFGLSMVFRSLSVAKRTVVKRLTIGFVLVLGIHTLLIVGERLLLDAIPEAVAGIFYLNCVLLTPSIIYLVALYDTPILSTLTGPLRVLRIVALTGAAFGLSLASLVAVLAIWAIASIIFGFPLRNV